MSEVSEDLYHMNEEKDDNLTVVFDLGDVPSVIEVDDPLPQSDIYEGLFLHQEGVDVSDPT
ncbi:hypothetical protein EV424DRAFT_1545864 [Suillus variegatus]|nr:hypothetical protein EV424DRAFT_1545864 [Suillus variegatus]